jgi:hypothetical protein
LLHGLAAGQVFQHPQPVGQCLAETVSKLLVRFQPETILYNSISDIDFIFRNKTIPKMLSNFA